MRARPRAAGCTGRRSQRDIQYPEHPIDPSEVLTNVTAAKDASAALDSYNPPQKLYRELKAKLAELRGQGDGPVIQIAEGPALKFTPARGKKQPAVAMEDSRVPQLRAKLGITENADDTHYDAKVAEAVRKFQEGAELKPTGVLDERTVKAINSPKRDRQIDTVIVNMERWRWLPRDLGAPSIGDAYVILNIPDYTLKVMQNGAQVWTTKVVTGKPGVHATPLLTETMKFITVNPTWNVPPSIIYNEYLPALQQDPTVLQRMGLKLECGRDGSDPHFAAARRSQRARPHPLQFPEQVPGLSARHPGQELVRQGSSARSATAACGCRIRINTPRPCSASPTPQEHYTPEKIRSMYGHERDRHQIPDADPGQHHLPDGVCGRRRQAAVPQGRLWPRRHHAGAAQATAEARIWKTWSRIRSRTIRVRSAICRPASASPATTPAILPDPRSSNGCSV